MYIIDKLCGMEELLQGEMKMKIFSNVWEKVLSVVHFQFDMYNILLVLYKVVLKVAHYENDEKKNDSRN